MSVTKIREVCEPVWKAAGFENPSQVVTAYKSIFAEIHFDGFEKTRPYAPGALLKPLNQGAGNLAKMPLALYLIHYGINATLALFDVYDRTEKTNGKWPYAKIADEIAEDPEVQRLSGEISGASLGKSESDDAKSALGKLAIYALKSSRIGQEPEKDGKPPLGAVGYIKFDDAGAFDGKAYIFYGAEHDLESNGVLKSVEPVFWNSKGTILIEYELERQFMDASKDDREGFVKISPQSGVETCVSGATAFEGRYKDLDDGAAVNILGMAYLELFAPPQGDPFDLLKAHAAALVDKLY